MNKNKALLGMFVILTMLSIIGTATASWFTFSVTNTPNQPAKQVNVFLPQNPYTPVGAFHFFRRVFPNHIISRP